VPIDNNLSEQLMRHVATGRNNWMFSGSIIGGERAADLLTIVCSAHRNDLDVTAYVQGVLDAMLSGSTDYFSLRPDIWAAAHPEQIRIYRQEERRDRADRKQRRRALRREHLRTSARR
ncbi:MAG: transposase, partial [Planctomycetaceae bacterium]|nr:transposase [Planctomycetaceae bacterium]